MSSDNCAHHFILESDATATTPGVCCRCGEQRTFRNQFELTEESKDVQARSKARKRKSTLAGETGAGKSRQTKDALVSQLEAMRQMREAGHSDALIALRFGLDDPDAVERMLRRFQRVEAATA